MPVPCYGCGKTLRVDERWPAQVRLRALLIWSAVALITIAHPTLLGAVLLLVEGTILALALLRLRFARDAALGRPTE